jgi:hypothetical protein
MSDLLRCFACVFNDENFLRVVLGRFVRRGSRSVIIGDFPALTLARNIDNAALH